MIGPKTENRKLPSNSSIKKATPCGVAFLMRQIVVTTLRIGGAGCRDQFGGIAG